MNTKTTNYGKGFFFEFADGYKGWVMCFSTAEKRVEVKKHGKLVKWIPA